MENQNILRAFVAERIRYFRLTKGLSQEKLSEKANLEPKYINKIENQKYNIKIDTLEQILRALEIRFEEFFDFQFPTSSTALENLLSLLERIPKNQQTEVIQAISVLLTITLDQQK